VHHPEGQFPRRRPLRLLPLDSILPRTLSDRLGVTKYLARCGTTPDAANLGGRVGRCARGVVSYGLLIECENDWAIGTDVAAHRRRQWEPPPELGGDERA
jgi:hypothetical protein